MCEKCLITCLWMYMKNPPCTMIVYRQPWRGTFFSYKAEQTLAEMLGQAEAPPAQHGA